MALTHIAKVLSLMSAAGLASMLLMDVTSTKAHATEQDSDQYLATIGLQIMPSFVNWQGKDPDLIGLGSFIVNAQADCNGCHGSDPSKEFADGHNPFFLGKNTAKINQATYLSGGQNFGPVGPGIVKDPNSSLFAGPGAGPNIIARNLTPDYTGFPAGVWTSPPLKT